MSEAAAAGVPPFNDLARSLRPKLHRFCARMVGTAADGEDIVQEVLLKAAQQADGMRSVANPEAWLFHVAHNAALDFLRRRRRQAVATFDAAEIADGNDEIGRRQASAAAFHTFMGLTPIERSSVILMDVIGYSLGEICGITGATLPAVKAALHRGRNRLAQLSGADGPAAALSGPERDRLELYIDRFNARDFDAVRDLLAEDVRLDLVDRLTRRGKADVSTYFSNYSALGGWRLVVGSADGRPAILSLPFDDPAGQPTNVILLDWRNARIIRILDFVHAPYALEGATLRRLG